MTAAYTSTAEYLHDHRTWLALRLKARVEQARRLRGNPGEEAFLGLFLSEGEVDTLLSGISRPPEQAPTSSPVDADELYQHIQARLSATPQALRPQQLASCFNLPPLAVEVLLLLLAAEVDGRFARVYAYLQDDITRRWLSPGLALRLLPGLDASTPGARALFTTGSPLLQHCLVELAPGFGPLPEPLLERPLKLDDRIAEYLLEHDPLDARLAPWMHLQAGSPASLDDLDLEEGLRTRLENLGAVWQNSLETPVYYWGGAGSGKQLAARALAQELERPLLSLDVGQLYSRSPSSLPEILGLALREARLRRAVLLLRRLERLDAEARALVLELEAPGLIFSARERLPDVEAPRPHLEIGFELPGVQLRQRVWQASLNGGKPATPGLVEEVASRFRLTPGQIQQAAEAARHYAWLTRGPRAPLQPGDLFEGARRQSNPVLAHLAARLSTPYTWEDLVLPDGPMSLLRAIESQVRHAHTVHQRWGFETRLGLGRGLAALFSGPSGTGKTMAATILARSLGLDIYRIDLSAVVSKYIGETEKNLNRIFTEASGANAILFFDEADALFGKRSEVKDAHDRYANIEISYLLQKMEEYDGLAVLATNFDQNIDEAFTRRMHYLVAFPFPGPADRERIWRGMFPAQAPRQADIDYPFLAAQFDLSGGNIKNCVLAAAFLAAEGEESIGMGHLVQGVARELAKMGRPLTRSEFGPYYRQARAPRL